MQQVLKRFFTKDWVVWPEELPAEAIHVRGYLQLWWALIGPMGYRAMFRGKRMTHYNGQPFPDGVVETAAIIEELVYQTQPKG